MTDSIHRLPDSQISDALTLLATGPGTPRTAETWQQDHMTALVLGGGGRTGELGPLMPISRRTLAVAPGRTLQAGWITSNQFAARMSSRRLSRSTIGKWAELLPEVDALLVIRRDQASLAARWYAQTGFHRVLSIRCLYLDMPGPPPGPSGHYLVRVADLEELPSWQSQMAAVHQDVFGNYGGTLLRHENFWAPALKHHFYHSHYQFQVIGLWQPGQAGGGGGGGDTLMGYAVVGWSGWHSKRPRMDILELATRQWDTRVAEQFISTTCQLAWSKQVKQVRAVISAHDPYRGYLTRTGFEDRWGYVMEAKWLHPQRYLDRLPGTDALADLSVQTYTTGQVSLRLGSGPRVLRLQLDEGNLARLLLHRLEIAPAIREGALLAIDAKDSDLARLSATLPWTPWVFHMADYI